MKYIRTEDGIFEVDFVEYSTYYHTIGWNIFEKEQIIAQANTIEELCDEFVVKHIKNEKAYVADEYKKAEILKDRQKVFEYGVEAVYGAIWTDKGLIYVAKLNENGKLELI